MDKEKKTTIYKLILGAGIPLVYSVTFLPPDITVSQSIYALVSFVVIMYFAIKTLKYFKTRNKCRQRCSNQRICTIGLCLSK